MTSALRRHLAHLLAQSIHGYHAYYPFALEVGGRSAPMAIELVDRFLAILVVVRRFPGMHGGCGLSLVRCVRIIMSA
jgi:hypothetical protein